jgi:hypothetical protein
LLATSAMDWFSWPLALAGIAIVIVTGVLAALGVKFLQHQEDRGAAAMRLQDRIAGPLSREPSLADAAVLPVAHLRRFGRSTVELTGRVPSDAARAAAVQIAEREIARYHPGATVVDRLHVAGTDGGTARRSA